MKRNINLFLVVLTMLVNGTVLSAQATRTTLGGVNLGNLPNYLFVFTNGRDDANWQSASKGFAGDVAINGVQANERTSGSFGYAGTIYTNASSLSAWQRIVDNNGSARGVTGETVRIANLTTDLENAFTQINALPASAGYTSRSSTSLNGLNTRNGVSETFVINVTTGFSVSSKINITGDPGDVYILRWDNSGTLSDGYQGAVKFSSGGAIVPLGGLKPTNFIHVAGNLNSSGGGSTPSAPYPQGPRTNDGTGALVNNASNFSGGGFFTGYWLTTGSPDNTGSGQPFGKQSSLSNGIFVGGWFSKSTQFSLTSGTSGVYVSPPIVLGSIGDFTFCDNNSNGIFDNGDTPQSGVQVQLCNAANVVIATVTTNAQGKYLFPNLAAATYIVKFPATIAGGKTISTPNPITVPLAPGQNFLDADGGYKPALGSIGDQVYCDINNNGVFDAGDVTVTGLTVTLCDANFVTITTQAVDANGKYLFTNLSAGVYNVKFPETTLDGKPQRNLGPINVVLGAGQNYLDADKGYYKPTGSGCTHIVSDCKAGTNDRIGLILKNFFQDGSTATWNYEPGTTWVENADGSADLVGVISHYGNPTTRKFNISIHFTGKTFTAPPGSPVLFNLPNISTVGWSYYDWGTATLTGVVGTHLEGAKLTLSKRGKALQVGVGAADQFTEQTQLGGSGWFSWTIISQPYNGWLVLNQFPAYPSVDQADICFRLNSNCDVPTSLAKNEILYMTASPELNRAHLDFVSNTGSKNDFFTVEKVNSATGVFETIEIVNNKSWSDTPEYYTAYDNAPVEGDNIYRVKVTYLDGSTKITVPKTLTFKGLNDVRLFPNPADDILSLDLSKYKGKSVSIYLYSLFGQQVFFRQIENVGTETINLDISKQQTGSYMIRITAKGRRDVFKQLQIAK